MMNQEIKKQWVEALRSGNYKQGRGGLRTEDDRYCCLGVLCDVIDPDGWKGVDSRFAGGKYFSYGRHDDHSYLPEEVSSVAGINRNDQMMAAQWNDDDELSFDEIADRIESEF